MGANQLHYRTTHDMLAGWGEKSAPRVRLELTTYRLTAGRAADCAIQELAWAPVKLKSIKMYVPPAGIEPATNRLKVERST